MDSRKCYCCQNNTLKLLRANCGHQTCFHCIKKSKPGHKCKKCNERKDSQSLSPFKNKSAEKNSHMQSQQTRHSPFIETQRFNPTTSVRNQQDEQQVFDFLLCPDHKEPLNMFCKQTKKILCSVCLSKISKYSNQIMPLKNAEDFLRKENRGYRVEAKNILANVENAYKTINKNRKVFEASVEIHTRQINQFYDSFIYKLRQMQQNSIKLCTDYLQQKIAEYTQINDDLSYIMETLNQFRQGSNDSNSVGELAFFYTSFKVIKKTIETLSFDYISYERQKPLLIEFDQNLTDKVKKQLIKFRFNLQIKKQEKVKPRSSTKSPKKFPSPDHLASTKHKITEQSFSNKKHKFSLCSNGSFEYDKKDANVYQRLLQTKYKY